METVRESEESVTGEAENESNNSADRWKYDEKITIVSIICL